MGKIKITQTKSFIKANARQKQTIKALGLRSPNHSIEHEPTPQILGMVEKVKHLVTIEKI